MSGTTQFSFKAKILVGGEIVPIATEIVSGANAGDGVSNGFLFKLDLQPGETVQVGLGDIIGWIENLGFSNLAQSPGFGTIAAAFPNNVSGNNFDGQNDAFVEIQSFILNSTDKEKLFSISVDILGSDPSTGLIPLPPELAGWLKIDDLAISFTATSTSTTDQVNPKTA